MSAKASKKAAPKKKSLAPKKATPAKKQAKWRELGARLLRPVSRVINWQRGLMPRSPHKSFRRTFRRDYARSLEMPGYIGFTLNVWRVLWRHRATFGGLTLMYALLSGLLVGMASQSAYTQLSELLRSVGGEIVQGDVGKVSEAGLLLMASLTGGISPNLGEAQQLISGLLVILAWLTTVWLLRAFLAGHSPTLKDGLYNSGAPIVPTFLLAMLLILQLVPAAVATIGISAAMPTGLISQGVEAMVFWVAVLLLILLSLYWVTSTLIAMVVVTLPGMYPLVALKNAHELVVGRRLRIVLRIVWLFLVTVFTWALVMVPVILFDAWLKGVWSAIQWLPIVPLGLLVMGSASTVWAASYIYLLYRKVVDDDAAPA